MVSNIKPNFNKIIETKKICVSNQVMVTVSNNLKSVTPRASNFEAGLIFLIDQYKLDLSI